ncbi:hypothetical protein Rxycam_03180 [Rubrobacter xylanophilus DSM 9941]|uniref:DNA methylase N-4/N-6 domain-containing protein n=1 Tax=Rubrobacter xylanophilus TaxID=49319 RepID=A0A510HEQ7_9ACTN|nr:site-specific DNA-methyltransferase [Rubrobacter xylanophilus]QYJ17332.1 hypothetical protein Rxycam_03180 [Rubrobacter xylanophilus DSM 9941]BBL78432.1 hypothetical protein RxyAA322_02860 [Rubrobacter xylanophilus]
MTDALEKLQGLLRELFQFDREDLDFGIYRIMNHKRDEVLKFLDQDLLPQVKEAFAGFRSSEQEKLYERKSVLEAEISNIIEQAAVYGGSPEKNPRYGEATQELAEVKEKLESDEISNRLENEVYSDLYTFLRRYYKDGDFISLRRYKPGVYAIPYEGEEVKLYWANADQYYVKTAENFQNYAYRTKAGVRVRFRLVAAATEQNNVKGGDRYFICRAEEAEYDDDTRTLTVPFEYRPLSTEEKDEYGKQRKTIRTRLMERAEDDLIRHFKGRPEALDALEGECRRDSKNNPVSYLKHHLGRYTAKNEFDYFIHKDLGGFLRRELDFFLKNEVMHIDDLDTENERRVEQYLSKLKVIKRIGYKIIDFLAQIEDFQKKLFLKKKFVVSSGYCLTLDNVPEELYEEIAANDAQYEEWERLFAISEIPNTLENGGNQRSVEWLKANPYLVLDTKHFNEDFKNRLLSNIEDLDEKTDGLLINSENFQALNLLQERYREQVRCIYIDPPYNTGKDEFLYKDNYQHSSWLTMMENRLHLARDMLPKDGVLFVSTDDIEHANLEYVVNRIFGRENFVANIIWQKKYAKQSDAKWFSTSHDHITLYAKNKEVWRPKRLERTQEQAKNYDNPDNDPRGPWQSVVYTCNKTRTERPNLYYPIKHPRTGKEIYPSETRVWGYSSELYEKHAADNRLWWGKNQEKDKPRLKVFLSELRDGIVPDTIWLRKEVGDTQDAKRAILNLFSDSVFDTPKPTKLVGRMSQIASEDNQGHLMLDFFAGSGTTGHAVIDLNREDGGNRKYVLVEMGEYFDTVMKPRIQKVTYSKDWKEGKPVSREGTSHIFKYMTLESYEDTLNNLELRRTDTQDDLIESDRALREEYMLSYMLDFETKGSPSLLNLDAFEDPFSYRLNITRNDETWPEKVDLVETFNYLLGLTVSRTYTRDGYRVVEGKNPVGERVLVIWRNTKEKTNDDLDAFFEERGYAGAGFNHVYVNGDNTLALRDPDSKVHLIEEEFSRLMFETEGS